MEHPTEFPLRENCNPEDPEEAFLWMLVAMPLQKGAPLMMPVEYLRALSKRLWDCGSRPVAEPVIKYEPPLAADPHWMYAPGTWVDVVPETERAPMDKLSRNEKIRAIAEGNL